MTRAGLPGTVGLVALLSIHASGCPTPSREEPRTSAAAAAFPAFAASAASAGGVGAVPAAAGVPAGARGTVQRGRASYYSDRLAGRPTASGEPYDPRALTAAHRTLPFGSLVDVVRRDGRRVRVRINDRGPFARGKIIDLSRRAAEAIGLINDGVTDVLIELVSRPPKRTR
jgi:rare lipoprotein A